MILTTSKPISNTLSVVMKNFALYNAWANKTMIYWLQSHPEKLMDKETISSFPTIRLTLLHILSCQDFWLSVLEESPQHTPNYELLSTRACFDMLLEQSEQMTAYILSLSDAELSQEVVFTSPWVQGKESRFEYIHHVFNHSTYHRGQIVTMGRNLGITDAPMTDYGYYLTVR
ncbi:damage-inducible protein DinB [Chitinophaga caeni]|uniref:Damage-inducible protein DinB n=1 Tax=Chitinophaga caeni TaxID=2029983 RepID=A0A291QRV9_9BACT|nr:DinB family protein [Chitinophaga caeni]ATL46622.1 damage-inducible protein DinB [Chitinophaga caeni]